MYCHFLEHTVLHKTLRHLAEYYRVLLVFILLSWQVLSKVLVHHSLSKSCDPMLIEICMKIPIVFEKVTCSELFYMICDIMEAIFCDDDDVENDRDVMIS